MRRVLITCMLVTPLSGCAFMSMHEPLTLGAQWRNRIPQERETAPNDMLVVRAQSAANETQRTLASTLSVAELLFIRAPVYLAGTALLRPFGMSPEVDLAAPPRPKLVLTSHSPDGQLYLDVSKHPPNDVNSTSKLDVRIIGSGEPRLQMEQTFLVSRDVSLEKATAAWDVQSSKVTIISDDGRKFELSFAAAVGRTD